MAYISAKQTLTGNVMPTPPHQAGDYLQTLSEMEANVDSASVARLEQAIAENDKNMRADLSGYFQLENAAVTNGRVLAWLAKWGIVGIALAWLWSNALSPLMKKFGVF